MAAVLGRCRPDPPASPRMVSTSLSPEGERSATLNSLPMRRLKTTQAGAGRWQRGRG